MKVGDLVKYKIWVDGHGKLVSKNWTGIIVEAGVYTGNNDLVILWHDGTTDTESRDSLEVVNESR